MNIKKKIWKPLLNKIEDDLRNNGKRSIYTYQLKNALCLIKQDNLQCKVVQQYKMINMTNFKRYKDYTLFYRLFKYTNISLQKPANLSIIYEPYKDDYILQITRPIIYIYRWILKNGIVDMVFLLKIIRKY